MAGLIIAVLDYPKNQCTLYGAYCCQILAILNKVNKMWKKLFRVFGWYQWRFMKSKLFLSRKGLQNGPHLGILNHVKKTPYISSLVAILHYLGKPKIIGAF